MSVVLPPWSFSMLETFEQCPRKWYHRYILKDKEPETEALRHGKEVHKALEDYLRSPTTSPLPHKFNKYAALAASVNNMRAGKKLSLELKMGVKPDLSPTTFFAMDVWGRCASDVIIIDVDKGLAWLGDWKTGKAREKGALQLGINALFIFKHFPRVNRVVACNLWLEDGKPGQVFTFYRENEGTMWAEVIRRVQAMEHALRTHTFTEMPSPLCGWCSVKTCQHNRG